MYAPKMNILYYSPSLWLIIVTSIVQSAIGEQIKGTSPEKVGVINYRLLPNNSLVGSNLLLNRSRPNPQVIQNGGANTVGYTQQLSQKIQSSLDTQQKAQLESGYDSDIKQIAFPASSEEQVNNVVPSQQTDARIETLQQGNTDKLTPMVVNSRNNELLPREPQPMITDNRGNNLQMSREQLPINSGHGDEESQPKEQLPISDNNDNNLELSRAQLPINSGHGDKDFQPREQLPLNSGYGDKDFLPREQLPINSGHGDKEFQPREQLPISDNHGNNLELPRAPLPINSGPGDIDFQPREQLPLNSGYGDKDFQPREQLPISDNHSNNLELPRAQLPIDSDQGYKDLVSPVKQVLEKAVNDDEDVHNKPNSMSHTYSENQQNNPPVYQRYEQSQMRAELIHQNDTLNVNNSKVLNKNSSYSLRNGDNSGKDNKLEKQDTDKLSDTFSKEQILQNHLNENVKLLQKVAPFFDKGKHELQESRGVASENIPNDSSWNSTPKTHEQEQIILVNDDDTNGQRQNGDDDYKQKQFVGTGVEENSLKEDKENYFDYGKQHEEGSFSELSDTEANDYSQNMKDLYDNQDRSQVGSDNEFNVKSSPSNPSSENVQEHVTQLGNNYARYSDEEDDSNEQDGSDFISSVPPSYNVYDSKLNDEYEPGKLHASNPPFNNLHAGTHMNGGSMSSTHINDGSSTPAHVQDVEKQQPDDWYDDPNNYDEDGRYYNEDDQQISFGEDGTQDANTQAYKSESDIIEEDVVGGDMIKKDKQPTAPSSMVLFYTFMILAVLGLVVSMSTYQARCKAYQTQGSKQSSSDDRKRLLEHEFA